MNNLRTSIFVAGLLISILAAGCGSVDAPAPVFEGNRTEFSRAVGYAVTSPDGSVDVTLVSREGAPLMAGHWDATASSLSWTLDDGTVGGLTFERFVPTELGVTALIYTQWDTAYPEPQVTCHSDGTCTTEQALACEFNCMFWTGDDYGTCWCGCNPDQRSCSYGCCI